MTIFEVVERLRRHADAADQRARVRAANTVDGRTPAQRRMIVNTLERDARFLRSLADELQRHGLEGYSAENRETLEYVVREVHE